jgi:hypothetical protein
MYCAPTCFMSRGQHALSPVDCTLNVPWTARFTSCGRRVLSPVDCILFASAWLDDRQTPAGSPKTSHKGPQLACVGLTCLRLHAHSIVCANTYTGNMRWHLGCCPKLRAPKRPKTRHKTPKERPRHPKEPKTPPRQPKSAQEAPKTPKTGPKVASKSA